MIKILWNFESTFRPTILSKLIVPKERQKEGEMLHLGPLGLDPQAIVDHLVQLLVHHFLHHFLSLFVTFEEVHVEVV